MVLVLSVVVLLVVVVVEVVVVVVVEVVVEIVVEVVVEVVVEGVVEVVVEVVVVVVVGRQHSDSEQPSTQLDWPELARLGQKAVPDGQKRFGLLFSLLQ